MEHMLQNTGELRILVMGNLPYPHGMAGTKRVQHFIDGFKAAGNAVEVLLLRQAGRNLKREEVRSSGVHRGVPFYTIGKDLAVDLLFPVRLFRFLRAGIVKLASFRSASRNVVYYYGVINLDNFIFLLVARRMGYKIVFDIVEDNQLVSGQTSFLRKINSWFTKKMDVLNLKWGDGIVVISHHLMGKYTLKNKWDRPITLIPISAYLNYATRPEISRPEIRIMYAGSFQEKDGVDLLIEAVRTIRKQHPVKLYLIGTGSRVEYYKATYGAFPEIEFMGYLNDETYYNELASGDIMCVPRIDSEYAHGGFPFKLGEYLATGNPVIASDTGDVSLYLKDGENAMLIPPGNVRALIEAITFLIEHPQEAKIIGERGKSLCAEKFRPETNASYLVKMVDDLFIS